MKVAAEIVQSANDGLNLVRRLVSNWFQSRNQLPTTDCGAWWRLGESATCGLYVEQHDSDR